MLATVERVEGGVSGDDGGGGGGLEDSTPPLPALRLSAFPRMTWSTTYRPEMYPRNI